VPCTKNVWQCKIGECPMYFTSCISLTYLLSPLLRKQPVKKDSKCWDFYHWISCPIVALHNYLLWPGFVASVAKSQLTYIIWTPRVKCSTSCQCYSEVKSCCHLLARSHLQSSDKSRFQYFLVALQSNSTAAITVPSKCEDLQGRWKMHQFWRTPMI
jgi:hypothetical protein